MKQLFAAITAVLLLVSCGQADSDTSPASSAPAESASSDISSEESRPSAPSVIPYEFTTSDIFGNEVTHETFGEKEVYFVHLWATWCPPCIRGMPDLAEIAAEYADRVAFIALVDDFDNTDGVKNIIESADVPESFVMLDGNAPELAALRGLVQTGFVPSTALITADNHKPEPIKGRDYRGELDALLS
jgi:thiol-disulfide isomerase/thioredoxin